MVDQVEIGDQEGSGRTDAILVSVPPPEGPMLVGALRARGYAVYEVALAQLGMSAIGDAPRVMIVDVDQPGAVEAIDRARELAATAELLCVGDPARAAELGVSTADGHVFTRPLDLEALVLTVVAHAAPGPLLAPTSAPRRGLLQRAMPAGGRASESPLSESSESSLPSMEDPLDIGGILPALDDMGGSIQFSAVEPSPELAELLYSAENRLADLSSLHPSSIPSEDPQEDLILPEELLAALDEPLAPEDEAAGTGSHEGTGEEGARGPEALATGTGAPARTGHTHPKPATTGARTGMTHAVTGPGPAVATGTGDAGEGSVVSRRGPPTPAPPQVVDPGRLLVAPTLAPDRMVVERSFLDPPLAPLSGHTAVGPRPATIVGDDAPRGAWTVAEEARSAPGGRMVTRAEDAFPRAGVRAPPPLPPPPAPPVPTPAAPPVAPIAPPAARATPALPVALREGDAIVAVAQAVATRASGSLVLGPEDSARRIVLRDGDIATAAGSTGDETLVAFLAARGDLSRDVANRLAGKLPPFGRHAGAALIAHGHLGQDDLWPVLRAHAEWILGRALQTESGGCELEPEPPGRLKAEPNVFGGATGAEVLIESIRRVVAPEVALRRLGGSSARLADGPRQQLLAECALRPEEEDLVRSAAGRAVVELTTGRSPELSNVLYALVALGVLEALAPTAPRESARQAFDPLDDEAIRQRVRARIALVEDGDYFSLLGVAREATGYEIRRAYLELRRAFEPGRVLTPATADLIDDVHLVLEVLDEAYEILREPHRRDRYRRAIEAGPPA